MRAEARFLLIVAAFFAVVTAVYAAWSKEAAGAVMLFASALLGLVPGLYYLWWSHRMDPRPEDDPNADPEKGAGVVAAFPHNSIWPLVFGVGAALVGLAFVYGVWTAPLGIGLAVSAMVGVIAESRRGGYV